MLALTVVIHVDILVINSSKLENELCSFMKFKFINCIKFKLEKNWNYSVISLCTVMCQNDGIAVMVGGIRCHGYAYFGNCGDIWRLLICGVTCTWNICWNANSGQPHVFNDCYQGHLTRILQSQSTLAEITYPHSRQEVPNISVWSGQHSLALVWQMVWPLCFPNMSLSINGTWWRGLFAQEVLHLQISESYGQLSRQYCSVSFQKSSKHLWN